MSSTLVDTIKELVAKVPDIKSIIEEATRTPEKVWAETAYIFNGFDEMTLRYAGQPYHLPFGKVTTIHGKPAHREIDSLASRDGFVKFTQMPLTGERIAREMIDAREMNLRGFVVLLTPTIPLEVEEAARQLGYDYKMNTIESYKIGRDRAKAGQPGKMRPDKRVYKWMKEFAPDDEIFAQQSRRTDSQTAVADALKMLAENQKLMLEMQVELASLKADRAASASAAASANLLWPVKNSSESAEQFEKRLAKWKISHNVE